MFGNDVSQVPSLWEVLCPLIQTEYLAYCEYDKIRNVSFDCNRYFSKLKTRSSGPLLMKYNYSRNLRYFGKEDTA
jgi:hypothetical protein